MISRSAGLALLMAVVLSADAADAAAPVIASLTTDPRPSVVGGTVSMTVLASDPDNDALTYTWDFGDGSGVSASANASVNHAYAVRGRYRVVCSVSDGATTRVATVTHVVHAPWSGPSSTSSSPLAYDASNARVWVVNPDHDTVAAFDAETRARILEIPVGTKPMSVAIPGDGNVWIACENSSEIRILSASTGYAVATIKLPYGAAPRAITASPSGMHCYVACGGVGAVYRIATSNHTVDRTQKLGHGARALSISGDGLRIFVARFQSPDDGGDVWELDSECIPEKLHRLAYDPGPDAVNSSRGVPNYLMQIVLSPDSTSAWVPGKLDNISRGLVRDGLALNFENTIRAAVSRIDLSSPAAGELSRIHPDDRELASAACFSPLGDLAFIAFQGNNSVSIYDGWTGDYLAGLQGAGLQAPQGLCIDPVLGRLWVQGFLSRSVAVYDISAPLAATGLSSPLLGTSASAASEPLAPEILLGKRIFYNAQDPRMGTDGYISCASCHLDGGHDGRVYDFTDRGEGLRNTITLHGRRGTGHGRVHWSANFDEIQDFEHDMRGPFAGSGMMADADFHSGGRDTPLGAPKAGFSVDLDALSAYVSSLSQYPASPYRNSDGTLTADASAGRQVFQRLNCHCCHGGADYTDSASGVLHDVGTLKSTSGSRLGGPLTGLDAPTLRGVWETTPYLHDGSAPTLIDVFAQGETDSAHGGVRKLTNAEQQQLVAFLLELDGSEPEVFPAYVTITSHPSNVALTEGQAATFSIVASGDGLLRYQWQVNGENIIGATAATYTTPATVGGDNGSTFRAVVSNEFESAISRTATLTVNRRPELLSPLTATPSDPWVGEPVVFAVSVRDPEGSPLAYSWDFGDGSGLLDASIHSYTTAGTYTARVAVDDGAGGLLERSISVIVRARETTPDTDGDGLIDELDLDDDNDGVSDANESADGTDPLDEASFVKIPLTFTRIAGFVRFAVAGKDRCFIEGIVPGLPARFNPAGCRIDVNLNGVPALFVLSKEGRVKMPGGSFRIQFRSGRNAKSRLSRSRGLDLLFKMTLTGGTWSRVWGIDGDSTAAKKLLHFGIELKMNGRIYSGAAECLYNGRASKFGAFRK